MDELESYGTMERAMMTRAAQRQLPINGSMELLPLCNMDCAMCYVRLSRAEMEAQGRMRTGAEWLALGAEMAQMGTLFLLLTGGEPLLHPDFKEIFLGLKKLGMILTINTNATLIDEEWADFFAKNKPRRINITLYGADNRAYETICRCSGGFDRVVHAVKLLRRKGVDVRLGVSVTPENRADLPRIYRIAEELDVPLNVDRYMMPAVRERGRPFEQQHRLLPEAVAAVRILEKHEELDAADFAQYRSLVLDTVDSYTPGEKSPCAGNCLAGKCSFAVNWQGLLRPCVITTEPAAPVFELGFAQAWRQVSRDFSELRYCADCSVCALRPLCPVCPVACRLETGDYMGRPEYLCRYAEETVRLLREDET